MTPRQVDELSLWEFAAAVEGWNRAHGSEPEAPAPSADEHDALVEKYAHI